MLNNRNYTVLYATTSRIAASNPIDLVEQYEMSDYDQPMHTDLKRDLRPEAVKSTSDEKLIDGPLFERYQFFTPGNRPILPILLNHTDFLGRSFYGSPC